MQLSHLFRNSEFFIPFKAGDFIFKEGEAGDEMYVVLEGEVDVIVHDKVVETVRVDNFLGEMALIDADSQPVFMQGPDGEQALVINGEFEVGRPAGVAAGTPIDLALAINLGPIPLPPGPDAVLP